MYSKIALKNVKKSFKDYSIYFLTLTLAVCIFYSFNSIESQKAMIDMHISDKTYVESFTRIISYMSVFVLFILGGLILYANNFLIKRRNKELGIYMTLGMSKNKISIILMLETLIVGIFSLISGLILGVIASQGLSILISKLFEFEMSGYNFTISIEALKKTTLCFGIMFIIVMIFNYFIISKYKIIDLLTAGKKTEEIKFKNQFVYLVAFILCIISLGTAYKLILDNGLDGENIKLIISIVLGIIGTILFFFSLSGFILLIVKKNKNIYFKGLNIFTIKQINSKVNTNFISMSVICLMLFITISVLSTGFSFKEAIEEQVKQTTPFDATASLYVNQKDKVKDIKKSLDTIGVKFDKDDRFAYYNEYIGETNLSQIINLGKGANTYDTHITYVKLSEYNAIRKLKNEKLETLKNNEVLVISNSPEVLPLIQKYIKDNKSINLENKVYNIKNKEVIQDNLKTFVVGDLFTVIINDEACNNMTLLTSNININFAKNDRDIKEKDFISTIKTYMDSNADDIGYIRIDTKSKILEDNRGMTTKVLFVGIYIGIVFLISSMAVLALQQLSEANDSIDRYTSLKRLGVSTKSINKTIFKQTLVYFSIPVILALIHSLVGIKVANEFILMYNKPDIGKASLMTASIFMTIYTIYFYITYSGYKNIVKNNI